MKEESIGTNIEPFFLINSKMEISDHKKYLYIMIFRLSKITIPYVILFPLLITVLYWKGFGMHNPILFIVIYIILIGLSIFGLCWKVDRIIQKRIKTDKTGSFCCPSVWKFHEEKIVMEDDIFQSRSEIRYDQFYKMLESKEYYIFYLNSKQAILLRKKDIEKLSDFENFIVPRFKDRYKKLAWRSKS